jgi:NitT/TauT family transport system substrate-binding protein
MRAAFMLLATVAIYAGGAPSCGLLATRPPAPTPTPVFPANVSVAYGQLQASHMPLWYAKENGVFQKHGLNVDLTYITGGTKVYAALLANDVQFAHAGGSESLTAEAEGADIVMVAMLNPVWSFKLIVPADIKSVSDLKGKNIAHGVPGGSTEIALRVVLPRIGLDPDRDVNLINLPNNNGTTAAMLAGKVQGGLLEPPDSITLEQQGFHTLVDLAALKLPSAQNGISVQRSFLDSDKPTVQRYIDAIVESTALVKKDEAGSMAVLKKYLKLDDEDLLRQTYRYFTQEVIPDLPYPRPDQFTSTQIAVGAINPDVDQVTVTNILDPSFVQSAANRGLNR